MLLLKYFWAHSDNYIQILTVGYCKERDAEKNFVFLFSLFTFYLVRFVMQHSAGTIHFLPPSACLCPLIYQEKGHNMRGMEKYSPHQMTEQLLPKHPYIQEAKGSRLGNKLRLFIFLPLLPFQCPDSTVLPCKMCSEPPGCFAGGNIQVNETSLWPVAVNLGDPQFSRKHF